MSCDRPRRNRSCRNRGAAVMCSERLFRPSASQIAPAPFAPEQSIERPRRPERRKTFSAYLFSCKGVGSFLFRRNRGGWKRLINNCRINTQSLCQERFTSHEMLVDQELIT